MIKAVGVYTAIFLLTVSSCSKMVEQGYALELDGVGDSIKVGETLNLSVQLKKDGTNYSVAADTIEVTLQVVCGNNKSDTSKAKADAQGKVSFAPLTLVPSWQGKCKINLAATIAEQEITATHEFTIGNTDSGTGNKQGSEQGNKQGSEQGDTDGLGGIGTFVAGTERTSAELEKDGDKNFKGYLFLQNCTGTTLFALDGDNLQGTDDEGKLTVSTATKDWRYVIVGVVPSACQLMYTATDINAGRAVSNVVSAPADSPALDKITMVRKSEHNNNIVITTGDVSDGSLYVANDGTSWDKVNNIKWNDTTTTDTKWGAVGSDNHAVLRVVEDNKAWWSLTKGAITVGIVKSSTRGGKLFSINGLGSNKQVKIKLTNDLCGVRVMHYKISGAGVKNMDLGAITTTEREMTADVDGTLATFFAVDDLQQGCKLSFTIDGKEATAVSTASTKSDLPKIYLRKSSRNSIEFTTDSRGRVEGAYIFNNGIGSRGRSAIYSWLGTQVNSATNWHSPANKNIVIVILATQGYMHAMYKQGS